MGKLDATRKATFNKMAFFFWGNFGNALLQHPQLLPHFGEGGDGAV